MELVRSCNLESYNWTYKLVDDILVSKMPDEYTDGGQSSVLSAPTGFYPLGIYQIQVSKVLGFLVLCPLSDATKTQVTMVTTEILIFVKAPDYKHFLRKGVTQFCTLPLVSCYLILRLYLPV